MLNKTLDEASAFKIHITYLNPSLMQMNMYFQIKLIQKKTLPQNNITQLYNWHF